MPGHDPGTAVAAPGPRPQDPGVTTAADSLRLRLPVWARAWIVVFLPVWGWFALLHGDGAGDLSGLAVLVLALALAFGARMLVLGVTGTADGQLTVRNHWSTRTFRRAEIAGVEVDRADGRSGTGWAAWLRLTDGSRHRLDVTQVPSRTLFSGRLDRDTAAIRAWLDGPHASPGPRAGG